VTSKSSLLLCFQNYKNKKERKMFILSTFLFAWVERSGEELATNG